MFCGWQKTRCKFYCWLIFCQGQASILPSAFLRWFEPATVGSSSIHACARITKNVPSGTFLLLADGEGFEPPEELPLQRFSRPSHSTALPPIRNCFWRLPALLFGAVALYIFFLYFATVKSETYFVFCACAIFSAHIFV